MVATSLRAHFATRTATTPQDRALLDLICTTLERVDRITRPRHRATWQRFVRLLDEHTGDPNAIRSCAVTANLVAVVAFGDADDYAAVAALAELLGPERLARLQHRCSRFLEADPSLPWTTSYARRLVAAGLHERLIEGHDTASASATVAACARAAQLLVFEGIDPSWTVPMVNSVEEFLATTDDSSIVEWRHHIAMVAASPWSPYTHRLVELAEAADRPHAVALLEACVEMCREQYKERERELVAQEIKRLVAVSGVTQREFAAWIGTSASRLSTYISGAVTPSAAMLLRINRAARTLRDGGQGAWSDDAEQAPNRTVGPGLHAMR